MNDLAPRNFILEVDGNPSKRVVAAYLARFPSEHSQRAMAGALERAAAVFGRSAGDLPWHELSHEAFAALRARLIERFSPATVNLTLSAVRGVVKTAWKMGLTRHEDFMRAVDVPPWRAESLPAGRMLSQDELRKLFAVTSGTSRLARRDSAMLALLLGCGLRAAEVVNLTVADYNAETGEVRVVRGKGSKDRLCYLAVAGRKAVDRWLELRGMAAGALLCDVRRVGSPLVPHLSSKGLYYRVRDLLKRARLGHASPHDFRRTHISLLLDGGHDISTVQKLVGHASVTTTQRYDRRPEATKRAAAESIEIPYQEEN